MSELLNTPTARENYDSQEPPYPGIRLHQVGPYLGKIRPDLARNLVIRYSSLTDWVWDPFGGSGTISLECKLLGRNSFTSDINPYACALTRAKLHAPSSIERALKQLDLVREEFESRPHSVFRKPPQWVASFFHKRTLSEVLHLLDILANRRDYFSIGCLLGILHHERPGFLSNPSSHIIPYLRNKKFPQDDFPEMYEYKEPFSRLEKKIKRMLKYPMEKTKANFRVNLGSIFSYSVPSNSIDTIITSPPYMNRLDYSRDNRLRLWFLGVDNYSIIRNQEIRGIKEYRRKMTEALSRMSLALKSDGICVLVLGKNSSFPNSHDSAEAILSILEEGKTGFSLQESIKEDSRILKRTGSIRKPISPERILVLRGGS